VTAATETHIPGASYPGNYMLRRGTFVQEARAVARSLKRGDVRGTLHALMVTPGNLWNHYAAAGFRTRLVCSCCGASSHAFVHLNDHDRVTWNAACPACDSRSRHRGLALLMPRVIDEQSHLRRTLHFAPEGALARVLIALERLDYETTDLRNVGCDHPREDIQALSFADGSYDLVLCSHVLEHVPDDAAAIAELARILSPDGLAVISVPCDWRRAETVNFRTVPPGGHYRHYGRDVVDRLRLSFRSVQVVDLHDLDTAPNALSYGIRVNEMALLCKP
jgi:hypothetical protein